ncbi:hypothetical protein E4T56_gene11430 [Termitomyces sp. T112]|nr:hypothetical protein E4T56_gene11430 [Termitomyces sp. T112]
MYPKKSFEAEWNTFNHQVFLQNKISTANQAYFKHANVQCDPTSDWPPSTLVWLNQQNLKTWRPSIKLDHKCLSPFEVLQKVSMHTYKLNLPPGLKSLHSMFHLLAAPLLSALPMPLTAPVIPTTLAPPATPLQLSAQPPLTHAMPSSDPSMPCYNLLQSSESSPHATPTARITPLPTAAKTSWGQQRKDQDFCQTPPPGPLTWGTTYWALPPVRGLPSISPCHMPWELPLSTHPMGVPPSSQAAPHLVHPPLQTPNLTPSPCTPQATMWPPMPHPTPALLICRPPANSTELGTSHALTFNASLDSSEPLEPFPTIPDPIVHL